MVNLRSPYTRGIWLFNDHHPPPNLFTDRQQIKLIQTTNTFALNCFKLSHQKEQYYLLFCYALRREFFCSRQLHGRCIDLFEECYLRRNIVLPLEYDIQQSTNKRTPRKVWSAIVNIGHHCNINQTAWYTPKLVILMYLYYCYVLSDKPTRIKNK